MKWPGFDPKLQKILPEEREADWIFEGPRVIQVRGRGGHQTQGWGRDEGRWGRASLEEGAAHAELSSTSGGGRSFWGGEGPRGWREWGEWGRGGSMARSWAGGLCEDPELHPGVHRSSGDIQRRLEVWGWDVHAGDRRRTQHAVTGRQAAAGRQRRPQSGRTGALREVGGVQGTL